MNVSGIFQETKFLPKETNSIISHISSSSMFFFLSRNQREIRSLILIFSLKIHKNLQTTKENFCISTKFQVCFYFSETTVTLLGIKVAGYFD